MKVYLGNYPRWWRTDRVFNKYLEIKHKKPSWEVYETDWTFVDRKVEKFLEICQVVLNKTLNKLISENRKIKVKVHSYDVWSLDSTLAYIILPCLEKLNDSKHGAPYVDDEDVPGHLRSTNAPKKENDFDTDLFHHDRWDYVLGEMIWAFKEVNNEDGDSQFHKNIDSLKHNFTKIKEIDAYEMNIEENEYSFDSEGYKKYQERMNNGFRLFGKYFRALWD